MSRPGPLDPQAMRVDEAIQQVKEARRDNSPGGDSTRDLIDEGRR